jgi:hypothetical protein
VQMLGKCAVPPVSKESGLCWWAGVRMGVDVPG